MIDRYYFVIWERIIWRNIFLSVTKENFQDLVHFEVRVWEVSIDDGE